MAKKSKRPLAVVRVKLVRRIGDFILAVRTLVLNIGNNVAIFATPSPTLATVTTNTNALETAEATAKTRVQGAAAARDLKYDVVISDVNGLLAYVQTLADNSTDEATAISIIEASGFGLKNRGVRVKAPLSVKQENEKLVLTAKAAGKRASYEWEESTDGTTWTELPPTLQAKTSVSDARPGDKLFFRVRGILRNAINPWSAAVSIIVR